MNLAVIAEHTNEAWRDGPPWPVFPFFFLLVVGAVVAMGVFWTRRTRHPAAATAIVAERYARGEIDVEEYQERISRLREKRS